VAKGIDNEDAVDGAVASVHTSWAVFCRAMRDPEQLMYFKGDKPFASIVLIRH
jgi:hypothetical protein